VPVAQWVAQLILLEERVLLPGYLLQAVQPQDHPALNQGRLMLQVLQSHLHIF
jgi:hypothetical protein